MAECCGSKALGRPTESTVPPEEEVPPVVSSASSCWGAGAGDPSNNVIMDNGNCCCDAQSALAEVLDPAAHEHDHEHDDADNDNMSSSLQRQVDDLFDRYGLSPVTASDNDAPHPIPMDVQGDDKKVAPLSPLSFHASIVGSPSFEDIDPDRLSKDYRKSSSMGDAVVPSSTQRSSRTPPPEFRVRVVTSSSTVTVELVADDGSWTVDADESVSGDIEDDEVNTIDIDEVASFDYKHPRQSTRKSDYYSRLVWLLPASPTGLDDGSSSTGTGSLDMLGIEVVPQKHNPNDDDAVSCGSGPSTTCSESSDEDDDASSALSDFSRRVDAPESLPVASSSAVVSGEEERIDPSPVPMANTKESPSSRSATHVVPSKDGDDAKSEVVEPDPPTIDLTTSHEAIESAGDDGDSVTCDTATKPAAVDEPATMLGGDDQVTNPPEPTADPSTTNSEDIGTDPPDSVAEEEPPTVERDQSLLDATEEMEEEKLEDAIVLSFVSAGDAVLLEAPPATTSVALVEHQPTKTTARRVRSLLNGMFELDDDSNGSAGQRVQVKNVVQRIEEKMVVRRRTVTENRHFKVSRTKISSDEGSGSSRTTGSGAKAMDPMNLTCRLILRLASSDTESDASTSEDSSTTVTGSYQVSVAPTDVTQGAESKRMEDVQSFVMMFRQLRAVETRQERWERRFQHIHAGGPVDQTEGKDNDEVAARCTRLAERLKEISGRQIVLPDDRDRKRLEAEYRRLEKELEAYGAAFLLTQIHHDEQASVEAKWESDNEEMNRQALQRVRRYMPVKVRTMSTGTLARTLSPNGKVLPENVARKFKVTTTILQLLRISPNDVERMHPSVLEDLRMVDLTLVERRALHCHLKDVGAVWEKRKNGLFSERRWAWFQMLKSNFKEELALDSVRKKGETEEEAAKDDSDDEVSTSAGHTLCTLMNPESDIDYVDDYGFPEGAEYELLTSSPQPPESGFLPDFASTLNELRKTEDDADEVDFFAPLVERMKGLDDEALQFQNEIATLEETIRSLGICHSVHGLEHGKQISSSESSSTTSISS